ncbi:hypothetical protein DFH06DRAFT_1040837 [Mycena polygramma]|nr:hypothetical protein DFH06DRAFT_1040837 [Mycena polygramma]
MSHTKTPVKQSSLRQPGSQESPYSNTSGKHPDSDGNNQSDLKLEIRDELHEAVYEIPGLRSHTTDFAALHKKVLTDKNVRSWKTAIGKPTTKKPDDPKTAVHWMKSGPEDIYYFPFSNLLNAISEAVVTNTEPAERYYQSIAFSVYGDRSMLEGIEKNAALKPDLIACLEAVRNGERVSWNAVEGAVEVKKGWADMAAQAGTYARALLAARHSRRFAWVILLNNKTCEARVSFFHRGGLTATSSFLLSIPADFDGFVRAIVDLVAVPDKFCSGLDPSRADKRVALPVPEEQKVFAITAELCYRAAVRGRGTHVVRLERVENHTKPEPATTAQVAEKKLDRPLVSQPRRSPRLASGKAPVSSLPLSGGVRPPSGRVRPPSGGSLPPSGSRRTAASPVASLVAGTAQLTISGSATRLPEHLRIPELGTTEVTAPNYIFHELGGLPSVVIMKDAWPLTSRWKNEGTMFEEAKGRFGLPDVRKTFEVYYKDKGDHTFPIEHLKEPAKIWDVFGDTGVPNPEQRTHVRSVIATEGFPLREAEGPKHLVEALVHAMIGYLNLLRKEWEHRDVSNGNVLLVKSFDIGNCPADDEMHQFARFIKSCRGIITDGDQAIKWKLERELAGHRSGTLPFISFASLNTWSGPVAHSHSGVDDFESFIWILIWEVLHQGLSRRALPHGDTERLQSLKSNEPRNLADAKFTTLVFFKDEPRRFKGSYLQSLAKLLTEWCALAFRARLEMEELVDPESMGPDIASNQAKMEELCFDTGREYVRIGFKHLGDLPEVWPGKPV